MGWLEIAGAVIAALGGGAWLSSFWGKFKSNVPDVSELVDDVLKKMQSPSNAAPDRMDALTQAEALLRYFEAKGNTAGAEAILVVTKEILSIKA